jgi:hypothetical protein
MVAFTAGAVLTAANLNTAFNALTFRAVTGTSDTFLLADNGGAVSYSNASAITATVPPFSDVAYANGTVIQLLNLGAGVVTITAGVGVTLNGSTVTLAQNAGGTLIKTATNTWYFLPSASLPSSATATVATSQTTTSVTYTDLVTAGPAVTLTTGTKALVIVIAELNPASQEFCYMSAAVSGASTVAASDAWAIYIAMVSGGIYSRQSSAKLFTGLTAGSNTFTAKYRTNNGSTGGFLNREIIAINMGS